MNQNIGNLTIQYNRQERAWEVVGGANPQQFQAGPVGKQAVIKFAIREAFPEVATAVTQLVQKNSLASGRAWAAAQLLIENHVLEPGDDAEIPCIARVVSQQHGRCHHYYINHQDGTLTCTCPDYEAGGVVIGNQGLCKHLLAFLLGRHLNWPLHIPEKPLPPDTVQLRRLAAGRWRGRIATRVNGSQNGQSHTAVPTGIPAYANGEPVSANHQSAYASFINVTGRPPFNDEKLMSWYYGR
ncbi:MAG: SWIM zinc finger family protein [Anaerolineales bacterium]|nr:SWIM zinc finger family protein [Anaerolineales bacterium]